MKNKILQKSIITLVIAFISIVSFGGTNTSKTAYAVEPAKTTKELCEGLTPAGTYNPDGSCFIPNAKDCSTLGADYEEKSPADATGIVCKKSAVGSTANAEKEKVLKERMYIIIEIQQWLNTVIWPVLVMIGDLMNNNILFGAGMDERLREIWIPVRNLINLFFVLAMVAIAIYNILGIGEDNDAYSIKQILPKMIIAIIAVNFSFIGIKVFLDGINVLTTSIFALPDQVKEGLGDITQQEAMVQRFCLGTMGKTIDKVDITGNTESGLDLASYKVVILNFAEKNTFLIQPEYTIEQLKGDLGLSNLSATELNKITSTYFKSEGQSKLAKEFVAAEENRICTNDAKLTPRGKAFLTKYNSSNAALAMALNMSKIVFYQEIDITTLTESNISKLFINTIFSVAMYLIYVVSFLALFIVLLARLVVLWLGVVASPVIIVSMVLPVFKEKLGFGELVDKFVQNAIAPIMIALSMTVGWIMLRAIQNVNILSSDAVKITNGIPVAGLNTIQDLIVALGTVGVIWMAVSSAANKSIAEPITKSLYGALGQAGSFVGNIAWKHAPLFPVSIPGQPDKIMATPEILGKVLDNAEYSYKKKQLDKADMVSEALGFKEKGVKQFDDIVHAKNTKEALGIMSNPNNERAIINGSKGEIDDKINEFNKRYGGKFFNDLNNGGQESRKLKDLIEALNKETDESKKKDIREKIAKHLKTYGNEIQKEQDAREAAEAGTSPAAGTPAAAPHAFTEHDKVGGADIGAANVAKMTDATAALTKALHDKTKGEADIKPLLKAFEVNGHKPTAAELKAFITDPESKKRLQEIFGDDAKIKAAIDAAKTDKVAGAPEKQFAQGGVTAQPGTQGTAQLPGTPAQTQTGTSIPGAGVVQSNIARAGEERKQPNEPIKPEDKNQTGTQTGTV